MLIPLEPIQRPFTAGCVNLIISHKNWMHLLAWSLHKVKPIELTWRGAATGDRSIDYKSLLGCCRGLADALTHAGHGNEPFAHHSSTKQMKSIILLLRRSNRTKQKIVLATPARERVCVCIRMNRASVVAHWLCGKIRAVVARCRRRQAQTGVNHKMIWHFCEKWKCLSTLCAWIGRAKCVSVHGERARLIVVIIVINVTQCECKSVFQFALCCC